MNLQSSSDNLCNRDKVYWVKTAPGGWHASHLRGRGLVYQSLDGRSTAGHYLLDIEKALVRLEN